MTTTDMQPMVDEAKRNYLARADAAIAWWRMSDRSPAALLAAERHYMPAYRRLVQVQGLLAAAKLAEVER